MAIKVITPGKLPEEQPVVFRGECSHCHCKVECGAGDTEHIGIDKNVVCPTPGCNRYIVVERVVYRELLDNDSLLKALSRPNSATISTSGYARAGRVV